MKKLCIYHGNCADGFGAAWVVHRALGDDVEFHAGVYQTVQPEVTGRDVIMVDFSYNRPVLEQIISSCKSLIVLDHHKTAIDDLAFLPAAFDNYETHLDEEKHKAVAVFDIERSGAGITWDFFNDAPRPRLIDHIEDRDLWRFALPGTREIQANLFSYPYDFGVWDELMDAPVESLIEAGRAIERKHFKDIAELINVCRREMQIGGIVVPVASLPYTLTSDAGHLMATEHQSRIGVCYWDTAEGRVFSLRSTDDGPDVSDIAKQFGGGGHAHAAGFTVQRDHPLAIA